MPAPKKTVTTKKYAPKKYAKKESYAARTVAATSNVGNTNAPEKKYYDAGTSAVVKTTQRQSICGAQAAGSVVNGLCVNTVEQGDDDFNRQGRVIGLKSVRVRGSIHPGGNGSNDTARVILVYDKQSPSVSGVVQPLLIEDLLTTATVGAGFEYGTFSQINMDNRSRFVILREEMVTLGPYTTTASMATAGCPTNYDFDWYVKLDGLKSIYNTGVGFNSSPISGALWMVFLGADATSLSPGINVCEWNCRLRFVDV